MTSGVLYRWPDAAKFGRTIPKTKIYEQGKLATATRQEFVSDVERITWAYKLAESTIHLSGSKEVPEIQVFELEAKSDDVDQSVLAAIDKSVPFPVLFEIIRSSGTTKQVRFTACHKNLGSTKPRLSEYFTQSWLHIDTPREPLPSMLDLPSLYGAVLAPILPTEVRAGEAVSDSVERNAEIRRVERDIARLERRLRNEPQFNRKVEIRRELKEREAILKGLSEH